MHVGAFVAFYNDALLSEAGIDYTTITTWDDFEAAGAKYNAATGKASVGLVELERSHTFANINLTDNVVRFLTRRYNENPLVVQGPGAGPEVTAGGIFADLLRVCAYLGAKL